MENIRFNYRYRDAHNYKQFGSLIFSNATGISVDKATALLLPKLISEEFFVPDEWGLPRLHASPYNPAVDHEWHEFEEFELTDESAGDLGDVVGFLERLSPPSL
ncbi:hypothetical protein [Algoriphagus sp. Y33]|uniref:hypothetical protein n=1 Tax=Algoriphagus sp. Y33 TaxID=2772483 RepID=UPI001784F0D1|nr:hypothetical protein [Algoriphagus sp. Y33]